VFGTYAQFEKKLRGGRIEKIVGVFGTYAQFEKNPRGGRIEKTTRRPGPT